MLGGQLGFCCCPPTACQWRVLFTFDCGPCSGGTYPAKTYVVGTPEKVTDPALFQVAGDYPSPDNSQVMRYGRNPAAGNETVTACGDTPAPEDLDTTTQPSVMPTSHPCQVDWYCTYASYADTSYPSTDCLDCPNGAMSLYAGPWENKVGSGGDDETQPDCPNDPSGWIDSTRECSPADPPNGVTTGFCYCDKYTGKAAPRCPSA